MRPVRKEGAQRSQHVRICQDSACYNQECDGSDEDEEEYFDNDHGQLCA